MNIGVLAVQGAFIEHETILRQLGHRVVELRQRSDIRALDGLILPGGESTVQGKLLRELGMLDPLRERIADGLPVLGTCAGLILLAERIEETQTRCFGTLPVTARRNAYGRQLSSFETVQLFRGAGKVRMIFIRAPQILSVRDGVDILATVNDRAVAVRYRNQIGMAFHPELAEDGKIHRLFLDLVRGETWPAGKGRPA